MESNSIDLNGMIEVGKVKYFSFFLFVSFFSCLFLKLLFLHRRRSTQIGRGSKGQSEVLAGDEDRLQKQGATAGAKITSQIGGGYG